MKWLLVWSMLLGLVASANATTWTCTKELQWSSGIYYETVGRCVGTGNYTTGGGDVLGSAATMQATAVAVCQDAQQILVSLILSPLANGFVPPTAVCGWDQTNFKIVCSVQGTAGAGNAMVETTMAAVPTPFRFRALCR